MAEYLEKLRDSTQITQTGLGLGRRLRLRGPLCAVAMQLTPTRTR